MQKFIDKLVLYGLCAAFVVSATGEGVAYLLISLILMCLSSYFARPGVTLGITALFFGCCLYDPMFLFFAPVIVYDVFGLPLRAAALCFLVPWVRAFRGADWLAACMPLALSMLAALLQSRTARAAAAEKSLHLIMDESRETSLRFDAKSKELLEKQDYDVRLATLTERNRIARDIHDSVGHLLSRAILQVGALSALPEAEAKAGLPRVKETLTSAMDSVRESVHDLHEQSIDLPAQLESLCKAFTFCPVALRVALEGAPPPEIKVCVIAVVKESLSNVQRHSRASRAAVSLREHPGFYQLAVSDDGVGAGGDAASGLGLKSIEERVASLGGRVRFIRENGFTVFLTLPKTASKGAEL